MTMSGMKSKSRGDGTAMVTDDGYKNLYLLTNDEHAQFIACNKWLDEHIELTRQGNLGTSVEQLLAPMISDLIGMVVRLTAAPVSPVAQDGQQPQTSNEFGLAANRRALEYARDWIELGRVGTDPPLPQITFDAKHADELLTAINGVLPGIGEQDPNDRKEWDWCPHCGHEMEKP